MEADYISWLLSEIKKQLPLLSSKELSDLKIAIVVQQQARLGKTGEISCGGPAKVVAINKES